MLRKVTAAIVLGSLVTACSTAIDTHPPRTATEQLLISTAADRAAEQLNVRFPKGAKVFVDATNFEGYDAKYAIGAIRESLLKQGARLVDSKAAADTVVEIRAGALSTDEDDTLIGIPSLNFPIPFAGAASLPKVPFYEKHVREGVAKFAATTYSTKESDVIEASSDPAYGFSRNTENVALFFFSWTTSDTVPPSGDDDRAKDGK